jgi:hypothetical protein
LIIAYHEYHCVPKRKGPTPNDHRLPTEEPLQVNIFFLCIYHGKVCLSPPGFTQWDRHRRLPGHHAQALSHRPPLRKPLGIARIATAPAFIYYVLVTINWQNGRCAPPQFRM